MLSKKILIAISLIIFSLFLLESIHTINLISNSIGYTQSFGVSRIVMNNFYHANIYMFHFSNYFTSLDNKYHLFLNTVLLPKFKTYSYKILDNIKNGDIIVMKKGQNSSYFSATKVYWVEAGAKGDGTSEDNPAGNITYILRTYNLTNAIINVLPGVYDKNIEEFPLILNYSNLTLRATEGPSKTIIKGFIPEVFIPEEWATIKVRSPNITIEGFTICDGWQAILVETISDRTIIRGNVLKNNTYAVLICSSHNVVTDNKFIDNDVGVFVGLWWSGSQNAIRNNKFENNFIDIVVRSSNNMITENEMYSGILIDAPIDVAVSQTIDVTNTIGGKPIRYYVNQSDVVVPKNSSQVILVNCTRFLISGLNISNACVGVELLYCSNVMIRSNYLIKNIYNIGAVNSRYLTVVDNKLLGGVCGIFFNNVNNSWITDNEIFGNYYGVFFMGASNNTLSKNIIRGNNIGILLRGQVLILGHSPPLPSCQNKIVMNHISNNSIGISINKTLGSTSVKNLIWKNNFLENSVHAYDECGENFFNSTEIGNYWDDYNGTDKNGDGIGDIPYEIPGGGGSKDYKPAMKPFNIFKRKEEEISLLTYILPIICIIGLVIIIWIAKKRKGGL